MQANFAHSEVLVTKSVNESSDDLHNCDPCQSERRTHEAQYFCGTCNEYFCNSCQRQHKKFKISRDHDIRPLSESAPLKQQVSTECTESKFEDVFTLGIISSMKLNVKLPSDKETPRITGCTFMSTGHLLLCDHGNSNIKLVSSKIIKRLDLRARPWSLAVLDSKTIIVTLPFAKKLQYVETGPTLSEGSLISFDEKCWGVTVVGKKIFISVHARNDDSEGEVRILDIRGNERTRVSISAKFQRPYHLAASDSGNLVCVSDGKASSIICLTSHGRIIQQITNDNLNGVQGLYVDSKGNIIATSFNNNTLQVISANGTTQKILLISRDGIKSPLAVAFRPTDGKLVVSCEERDEIFYFKLG